MENISRRKYLKLIGSLSGLIILNSLTGCDEVNIDYDEDNNNEEALDYDENGIKNECWKATGNTKQFNPGEHFIYTIISTKNKKNGQIIIPDGYEYISSEAIPETYWIKYNFINTVPVTALEYKHNLNDDIAFPYSGTPIQLENENSKQKTLS